MTHWRRSRSGRRTRSPCRSGDSRTASGGTTGGAATALCAWSPSMECAHQDAAEPRTGDPAEPAALEAMVRGRLLLAREVGGETAYELGMRRCSKGWTQLRRWLDSEGERRLVIERLLQAATGMAAAPDEAAICSGNDRRLLGPISLHIESAQLSELSKQFLPGLAASQSQSPANQAGRDDWAAAAAAARAAFRGSIRRQSEQQALRETAEQSELACGAISPRSFRAVSLWRSRPRCGDAASDGTSDAAGSASTRCAVCDVACGAASA